MTAVEKGRQLFGHLIEPHRSAVVDELIGLLGRPPGPFESPVAKTQTQMANLPAVAEKPLPPAGSLSQASDGWSTGWASN